LFSISSFNLSLLNIIFSNLILILMIFWAFNLLNSFSFWYFNFYPCCSNCHVFFFFGLLSMRLSESHAPSQGFDGLTWDDSVFFFHFHRSIMGWLRIEFHNLFSFAFYWVILV
jgi:hypothetical protein